MNLRVLNCGLTQRDSHRQSECHYCDRYCSLWVSNIITTLAFPRTALGTHHDLVLCYSETESDSKTSF